MNVLFTNWINGCCKTIKFTVFYYLLYIQCTTFPFPHVTSLIKNFMIEEAVLSAALVTHKSLRRFFIS